MATQSYPFTSKPQSDPITGEPSFDRAVNAEFMRSFYQIERSNGIITKLSESAYKVGPTSPASMGVKVNAGHGFINGAYCLDEEDRTIELPTAHPTLNRIDIIVLRLDLTENARNIELYSKSGIASSSPVAPALQRDAEIWELCLAEVLITASSTTIIASKITDTRDDPSKCGISTTGGPDISYPIPINKGGTNATTVAKARDNLGLGNTSGAVPIANGGTGATTKSGALENLDIKGAYVSTLLWTNAAPTSAFPAQTIELDLNGYKFVDIVSRCTFVDGSETRILFYTHRIRVGLSRGSLHASIASKNINKIVSFDRDANVETTGVDFGNGTLSTPDGTVVAADGLMIPRYIYGVKIV